MNDRPELPTSHRRRSSMFNVLPDDAPMTWGIWDLDGWLGEITSVDGRWYWRHSRDAAVSQPHATWQEAADELIAERPEPTL